MKTLLVKKGHLLYISCNSRCVDLHHNMFYEQKCNISMEWCSSIQSSKYSWEKDVTFILNYHWIHTKLSTTLHCCMPPEPEPNMKIKNHSPWNNLMINVQQIIFFIKFLKSRFDSTHVALHPNTAVFLLIATIQHCWIHS